MKITRKGAIISSLLFILIFPIPWLWFAEKILDNIFPTNFNWYYFPSIIAMILPIGIYILDTENDSKTKIINSVISLLIMILGIILFLSLVGFYYSSMMENASHAIT